VGIVLLIILVAFVAAVVITAKVDSFGDPGSID
jgi:hypothetical protein